MFNQTLTAIIGKQRHKWSTMSLLSLNMFFATEKVLGDSITESFTTLRLKEWHKLTRKALRRSFNAIQCFVLRKDVKLQNLFHLSAKQVTFYNDIKQ